jgi:hypothetical protein
MIPTGPASQPGHLPPDKQASSSLDISKCPPVRALFLLRGGNPGIRKRDKDNPELPKGSFFAKPNRGESIFCLSKHLKDPIMKGKPPCLTGMIVLVG